MIKTLKVQSVHSWDDLIKSMLDVTGIEFKLLTDRTNPVGGLDALPGVYGHFPFVWKRLD